MRVVCWFSCGAASAVATKKTIEKYPEAIVAYCDTGSEHPDNVRFLSDCEKWFGKKIEILASEKYIDTWDVFEKTRYLAGVQGARCTTELKKHVRHKFQKPSDLQIFGFTSEEKKRAERFKQNNFEVKTEFPLIDLGIDKAGCFMMLHDAGIELPMMYRLGYKNNNCIPCVKGGSGYFNKIRKDFPEQFDRMAKMERKIGAAINKRYEGKKRIRVFLDELDPEAGRYESEPSIGCGVLCDIGAEK